MKRFHTRVPATISKSRLDDFLVDWLSHSIGERQSKTKIRQLVLSGAVYVNRHRNKVPTTSLYSGAVIEVYYDERKFQGSGDAFVQFQLRREDVLFEDEWLIAIQKPAGLPTQPTIDSSRANLFDKVKQFLKESYVGLHHRLDKDTSGVILFTKKEEANVGVADLFKLHQIQKDYQTLVWKTPLFQDQNKINPHPIQQSSIWIVENYLSRLSPKNENARYGAVQSGGDPAITEFTVLDEFRGGYWLKASPKTGRTHQIRVHCSEQGIPILGDPIYFPKEITPLVSVPRLMLHAYQLAFIHPITKKEIKIECPLPHDFNFVLGNLRS